MKVNFYTSDFKRDVTRTAELMLKNRFFEQNPVLTDDGAALIARPGLKYLATAGSGPIRGMYSEPGAFDGDLFVISDTALYRVTPEGDVAFIVDGFKAGTSSVSMAAVQGIGVTPERLFIADGQTLRYYEQPTAAAAGTLTASGNPANGAQVRIDNTYYQFTTGSVDAGTPTGTSSAPWLVKLGATATDSLRNLYSALNILGERGVIISTNTQPHPTVRAGALNPASLSVIAIFAGVQGNFIITTETSSALSWSGATLSGGTGGTVTQITTPSDIGIFDIATVSSYVICIPVQEGEFLGRFYWIEPGEVVIDPLNFATAETYADMVVGVRRFGDQFWLPGERSTEVWYPTGDPAKPMSRLQGVVFDRGAWEGTAVAIKERLMLVDGDGGVFVIQGGAPQRVSNPAIEELIRHAIAEKRSQL